MGRGELGGSWEVAERSRAWLLSLEMVPWGQCDSLYVHYKADRSGQGAGCGAQLLCGYRHRS